MRLTGKYLFAVLGGFLLLVACSRSGISESASAAKPNSAPRYVPAVHEVAWEQIQAGALVVDVRTPAEYTQGHLPNAINIPYDQLRQRIAELGEDRTRAIVLYCRTGRRSEIARQTLRELGFTKVFNGGAYERLRQTQP